MSEYWKSTPKYWCKFCKIFLRDTNLEKKQHEATAKHQNNISKSLRDLHKDQGREDREKQKAKDEVARLNGLVGGKASTPASSAQTPSVAKPKPHFSFAQGPRATADDRRRQAEQLAAMGIAVPDEYRKDMAIASEWSTVSSTPIYTRAPVKDEEGEGSDEDKKYLTGGTGQRKRKLDGEVDEPESHEDGHGAARTGRKVWGTSTKAYPGATESGAQDFDALLSSTTLQRAIKPEPDVSVEGVKVKQEEPEAGFDALAQGTSTSHGDGNGASDTPVIFKKRKGKR